MLKDCTGDAMVRHPEQCELITEIQAESLPSNRIGSQRRGKCALTITLIICLVPVSQLACVTQRCTRELTQAPELRGFKLGMTLDQIKSKYPSVAIPAANEFGLTKITLSPSMMNTTQHPELSDTKSITLEAVDGRLSSIKVKYTNAQKWTSVDEFLRRISESFNLDGDWEKSKSSKEMKWLWCNGFHLYAGFKEEYGEYQSYPYVELEDSTANMTPHMREYDKRKKQEAEEEERRKTFKP